MYLVNFHHGVFFLNANEERKRRRINDRINEQTEHKALLHTRS